MNPDEPVRAMLIPLTAGDETQGITLSQIAAVVRDKLLWIIGAGALCLVLALLIYSISERKYRVSTTFILTGQAQSVSGLDSLGPAIGGLASIAGLPLSDASGRREEALATLQSQSLIREFIAEGDLIKVLFPDRWSMQDERWETPTGMPPSEDSAIRYFQDSVLSIDRNPGANIVTLSITWRDPEIAANWANNLVNRVDERLRSNARVEAQQSIEFLENELDRSGNSEIQKTVYSLIESNMTTMVMTNVRPDFVFRIIDPAIAPPKDEPSWPRLTFILAAAACLWFLACCTLVLASAIARNYRNQK